VFVLVFTASFSISAAYNSMPDDPPQEVEVIGPKLVDCKKAINLLLASNGDYGKSVKGLIGQLNAVIDGNNVDNTKLAVINTRISAISARLKTANPLIQECLRV